MATVKNLTIDQGSSFSSTLIAHDSAGNVLSVTGATGRAYIRKAHDSDAYYRFTVNAGNTAGYYTLELSATGSAIMKPGKYYYDVEFQYANNTVYRDRQGTVIVDGEMTRDYGTLQIPTTEVDANFRGPTGSTGATGAVGATGPGLPYVLSVKPTNQIIYGNPSFNVIDNLIDGLTVAFEANSAYIIDGALLYDATNNGNFGYMAIGPSIVNIADFKIGHMYFKAFSEDEVNLANGNVDIISGSRVPIGSTIVGFAQNTIMISGFMSTLQASEMSIKLGIDSPSLTAYILADSYLKLTKVK